jgi:hypothetical protein
MDYLGRKSDADFVNFFALNARMLESMTLFVETNSEKFLAKLRQKLQIENRASSGAQFHFTSIEGSRSSLRTSLRCFRTSLRDLEKRIG